MDIDSIFVSFIWLGQGKHQRGHFPRWEGLKVKVCSVATKRKVRFDRQIFVTNILCSARHSSLFS